MQSEMHFLTHYSQWQHSHRHNIQPHWHHKIISCTSRVRNVYKIHIALHIYTLYTIPAIDQRRLFNDEFLWTTHVYLLYWVYIMLCIEYIPISAECIELPSESDGNVAMVWVILFRWRYACIVCRQTS